MSWIRFALFTLIMITSTILGFTRHTDAQPPKFPLTEDEQVAIAIGNAFSYRSTDVARDPTYDYLNFGPPLSIEISTTAPDRDSVFQAELIVEPHGFQSDTPAALLMIHTANPIQLFISATRPDRDKTLVKLPGYSQSFGRYMPHRGSTDILDDRMVILVFDLPKTTIREASGSVVTNLPAFDQSNWDLGLPTVTTVNTGPDGNYAVCPDGVPIGEESSISPSCSSKTDAERIHFYAPSGMKTEIRVQGLGSLTKHSRVDVSTPLGAEIDGDDYVWQGANNLRPFLSATDFAAIDSRVEAQFQSGIAFGVAGTAAVALIQEVRRRRSHLAEKKEIDISEQPTAAPLPPDPDVEVVEQSQQGDSTKFGFLLTVVLVGLSVVMAAVQSVRSWLKP